MHNVELQLNTKEFFIAERYAKSQNASLEKLMKSIFFEKVEDTFDEIIAEAAIKELEKDQKYYSLEEVKELLGIKKEA